MENAEAAVRAVVLAKGMEWTLSLLVKITEEMLKASPEEDIYLVDLVHNLKIAREDYLHRYKNG